MIIVPVDNRLNLFRVENVLSEKTIEKIQQENFANYPYELQEGQLDWNRKKLLSNDLFKQIDVEFNNKLDKIELATNVSFITKHCYSSFWLDYSGFLCPVHEDGAERGYTPAMAMQLYLSESPDKLGTTWYYDANGKQIRYEFPYKINTGYLMFNGPGQWHGMINAIPAGHNRISSYTYFGEFIHK